MAEDKQAVAEQAANSLPNNERKVAGKCPWCEKRKGEIDGAVKDLEAKVKAEDTRLAAVKEDLLANEKPVGHMVNIYRPELKELISERDRMKGAYLVMTHKAQCTGCGKFWDVEALSKPWSLELERGREWVREQERKRLAN